MIQNKLVTKRQLYYIRHRVSSCHTTLTIQLHKYFPDYFEFYYKDKRTHYEEEIDYSHQEYEELLDEYDCALATLKYLLEKIDHLIREYKGE